jgi:hypothetical protein
MKKIRTRDKTSVRVQLGLCFPDLNLISARLFVAMMHTIGLAF